VIRLRREIDRALANRWLRILLLVLLIGLFLLFMVHNTHDALADGEAFVCLALVMLFFIVVPPHVVVRAVATGRVERKRGPPRVVVGDLAFAAPLLTAIPLRR
jgi:uncharacterized membrane protein YkgB